MNKRRKLICIGLAIVMMIALLVPGVSPLSVTQIAKARELEQTTYYYANGNKITDVYGKTSYNGQMVPYRLVTIEPVSSNSRLVMTTGQISKKQKKAFQAGSKNFIKISYKWGSRAFQNKITKTIYSAFRDLKSIPQSFNTKTEVKNATGTALVTAKKSVVVLYIYWDGMWRKTYHGNCVYGEWSASVTATIDDGLRIKQESGTYSCGTEACNVKAQCKKRIESGTFVFDRISDVRVDCLGQTVPIVFTEPDPVTLGMKPFTGSTGGGFPVDRY